MKALTEDILFLITVIQLNAVELKLFVIKLMGPAAHLPFKFTGHHIVNLGLFFPNVILNVPN